ncbi:GNAT family N-acetyltransferase [Nocardioides euryhalodurans]|uniref:GNAT family N-acetyltransferase n=1 Tax=Nocardioides euryhalodurans TaxID=2518370 RepID=A0A4P7GPB0_9ACTN|nr:GNAT family N-acetyltransferase [Nocardioides euryhalodurans]QBR93933.1 GNAT family N-acetyltransferase [Nocardioides euryhalodurans]
MPEDPTLTFHEDPAAFLAEAGEHLAADPVLNTVVASVAERAAAEDADGVTDGAPYRWWVVARDGSGEVCGVAMRTAPFEPYPLFVLPMPDTAALALARALHARGEQVVGVNGAVPAARVCAEELARLAGGEVADGPHTRLHRLTAVTPPRPAPGSLRQARPAEVDLALAWFEAFAVAADEQAGREPGTMHAMSATREGMERRIALGEIWLWVDDDDVPVHLTAAHPPAFGAARIGPVFTPAEHRGRGYAGCTVAAVSQRVLDAGAQPCLYTDQANPTSNQLYAALGYRPVVDMVELLVRGSGT